MKRFQREWDIRAAHLSDLESVQAVASFTHREFEGEEFWISKTSIFPHLSFVAERGQQVLGWILGWHERQDDETKLRFNVHVEPSAGTALVGELIKTLEDSASRSAAQLRISLFENESQLLLVLQIAGFSEDHRTLFSRLTLSEANITRAEAGLVRCLEQGIVLSETSLQGADQSDFWQRLSAVHNTIMPSQNQDYDDPRPSLAPGSTDTHPAQSSEDDRNGLLGRDGR